MTRFGIGMPKKNARSARGDKKGCGDRAADEGTNGDALWSPLQDTSIAFGESEPMALQDAGKRCLNQASRSEEGGAL